MEKKMTICLVILVLCLCGSAGAQTTHYVGPGETYTTIQDAIDAASYGDTVEVASGTYVENIELKNGVAVIGAGASSTTIDGDDANSVVTAIGCDANTVLQGFTITDGNAVHGGGMYNEDSNTTITSCTFSGNSANRGEAGSGGGMCNSGSSSTITDCEFIGNTADYGGGMSNINCSPTVTDCKFVNNFVLFRGGGMNNRSSSSTVVNCTFIGNTADYHGGGMSIHFGSPTITDCEFIGNTAYGHGGGMYSWGSGSSIVTNCTFTGNSTDFGSGGGMYNSRSETVVNCTFSGNSSAYSGGGMLNVLCSPTVTNCTFSENHAYSRGGGMKNLAYTTFTCDPIITNCIMWGNTSGEVDDQISNEGTSTPTISYCDIARCWSTGQIWNASLGIDGGGNIDADPCFVDADGLDNTPGTEDDNLRLLFGSPCIDAGDNTAVPAGVTTDLDGNSRIVYDFVDMGAYEAQNIAPVADAGSYQAVYKGDTVYLDGSGSYDDNGDDLTYIWSFVSLPVTSEAVLSDPYIVDPWFVADVNGTYIVQLIVNDGFVDSEADEVEILAMLTQDDEITEALGVAVNVIGEISSEDWKKANLAEPLAKWIQAAIVMVEEGLYEDALAKLQTNVLPKIDGCTVSDPESNDWITDCEAQNEVYLLIDEAIVLLEELINEP